MTKKINKEKRITVRLTNSRHSELTSYAKAHELSLSEAVDFLIDKGLKSEFKQVATKEDIDRLIAENQKLQQQHETTRAVIVQAIKEQPITVQQLPDTKKSIFKSLKDRITKNDN